MKGQSNLEGGTGESSARSTSENTSIGNENDSEERSSTDSDEGYDEDVPRLEDVRDDWEPVSLTETGTENKGSTESSTTETEGSEESTSWTASNPWLTLNGYMRLRAEFQRNFFLGRQEISGVDDNLPFRRFIPASRNAVVSGGCGSSVLAEGDENTGCGSGDKNLAYGNMRLRLEPTISLGDDVRVHMQLDVFDNLVLGSTPNSTGYQYSADGGQVVVNRVGRVPGGSIDSLSFGQAPPSSGDNSLRDSLVVKRAWAEVTNRELGELRFGRMGAHWGLGMLVNDGRGIDADYQTDVDRVMGAVNFLGLTWAVMWDFANEGYVVQDTQNLYGLPYDATQKDDTNQWTFSVAKKMDAEEQRRKLLGNDWVLNGGIYFIYRQQFLTSAGQSDPFVDFLASSEDQNSNQNARIGLTRRDAEIFVPDIWVQFLWDSLRLELEAAFIGGSIRNIEDNQFVDQKYDVLQFGFAFEGEYRLLSDKLGLHLNLGFATGDKDVDGLSPRFASQSQNGDDTISTFGFHPNYRVDLILWRNIMQHVSGAYYFKPGVSYDFIRNAYGKKLGGQFDLIYSGASEELQTWGSDSRLGVELNLSVYYQSEDGPGLLDGFYVLAQYGVLFPLDGLGYPEFNGQPVGAPSLSAAHALRAVLGVRF